jgi:hypothetical protein
MAKTFLVTTSMRSARQWCINNGRKIVDVEVIRKPEDTYGYRVEAGDLVFLDGEHADRHTIRAHDLLLNNQRTRS